jgi:hypothetical protein
VTSLPTSCQRSGPPQLQDKNTYIQWHPSFSQLSSIFETEEQGQLVDASDIANSEQVEYRNASEKTQEMDELNGITKQLIRLGYNERS